MTGLSKLDQRLDHSADAVEAAALRLHSLYTGVERMLLLISRVVNGGTQVELQEYLRFRQLVRNLYGDELKPEPD